MAQPTVPALKHSIRADSIQENLSQLSWILEEGKTPLTVEDLFAENFHDATKLDLSTSPVFSIKAHRAYWTLLRFSNSTGKKSIGLGLDRVGTCWHWEMTFKNVEAYIKDSLGVHRISYSGTASPYAERDYQEKVTNSYIKLDIPLGHTQDIWVRLVMAECCDIEVKLSIQENKEINKPPEYSARTRVFNMFWGALMALFVVGLCLYLWLKKWVYLWFMLLQVGLFTATFGVENLELLYHTFFKSWPRLLLVSFTIWGIAKFVILLQFGRVYINTKHKFPKMHRLLGLGMALFILLGVLSLFSRSFATPFSSIWPTVRMLISAVALVVIICSLFFLLGSKDRLARVFCIGAIFPLMGLIAGFIAISALGINFSYAVKYTQFITNIGMLVTMTLALVYRVVLVTGEKDKAIKAKFAAEAEKTAQLQRINEAFNKFVPETFINFLGKNSIHDVALDDFVEKQVTVLFSDIRDYTGLSENMSPEENFRFVAAFNRMMGPIIQSHDGFINQYLGDGIMAIFPENATYTLKSSIAMQKALKVYNVDRFSRGDTQVQMGIGLHTGSLVMGIIGDEKRLDATTISDTVNVTSRLESLTKHYGVSILLSEACYARIENKEHFHFRYLGKVVVKGKQQSLGIYECFDADASEQFNLKRASLSLFEEGVEAYYGKEFGQAKVAFERLLKINPKDAPALLFLKKAEYYLEHPVASNWDGVERMEKK